MTVSQGLVSTIIPVYNRAGMIGASVQSVLDQTYRPIEIILVDDGSTDDSLAELNRLAESYPEIIRVAHRENGGPGLAREAGRLLAKGEFIQYLDSDDLLLPRKFEVQVAALREHPECGIAYGRSGVIDKDGKQLRDYNKWTSKKYEFLFPALLVDRWWNTHTPLYRKSLCDRIGPWPQQRPEDWDYDARAGALKTRLVYCDELVSHQRQHAGPCVSSSSWEQYLPQEAWFLPRLYDCAVQAGVSPDAPEMQHFVRWAFSLSRRMAAMGLKDQASELLDLATKARGKQTAGMRAMRWGANTIGWRGIGKLCLLAGRLGLRGSRKKTMALSWK